jgi:hypothetical protein
VNASRTDEDRRQKRTPDEKLTMIVESEVNLGAAS